jgi:hypothetical protein
MVLAPESQEPPMAQVGLLSLPVVAS